MSRPSRQWANDDATRALSAFKRARECYWCGLPMKTAGPGSDRKTREHLLPRSWGGENGNGNIVAACAACNHARGVERNWVPFHVHQRVGWVLVREGTGEIWRSPRGVVTY